MECMHVEYRSDIRPEIPTLQRFYSSSFSSISSPRSHSSMKSLFPTSRNTIHPKRLSIWKWQVQGGLLCIECGELCSKINHCNKSTIDSHHLFLPSPTFHTMEKEVERAKDNEFFNSILKMKSEKGKIIVPCMICTRSPTKTLRIAWVTVVPALYNVKHGSCCFFTLPINQ